MSDQGLTIALERYFSLEGYIKPVGASSGSGWERIPMESNALCKEPLAIATFWPRPPSLKGWCLEKSLAVSGNFGGGAWQKS